jgi:hypothetical protein
MRRRGHFVMSMQRKDEKKRVLCINEEFDNINCEYDLIIIPKQTSQPTRPKPGPDAVSSID